MKRLPAALPWDSIPAAFHTFADDAVIYDSSCSPTARVWFLDKGPGFYLKTAPKGALGKEAEMTRFFHSKGLSTEVLAYESLDADWLLTRRIPGEDCTHAMYLEDPIRLCDTFAQLLRFLHSTDPAGCPAPNRTADYLATAKRNFESGVFSTYLFPAEPPFATARDAWREAEQNGSYLHTDTLLHGDYCLPNVMLDNWRFSGFIDMDNGGVGDRHVDLFWGIWSLGFNLKTNRYRDRFLDAYGREDVCEDALRTVTAIEMFG